MVSIYLTPALPHMRRPAMNNDSETLHVGLLVTAPPYMPTHTQATSLAGCE
jgi:hypothetical protein